MADGRAGRASVQLPEGSSSEAPVMRPGPRSMNKRTTGLRTRLSRAWGGGGRDGISRLGRVEKPFIDPQRSM